MKNTLRILISALLVLAMALSFASCAPSAEEFYIDGSSYVNMQVGDVVELELVKPDSLKGKVEWTSDNENVVIVANGVLVAQGEGTTMVHATLDDYSDKVIVTVGTPKPGTGNNSGNTNTGNNTGNNNTGNTNTGTNGGTSGGNTNTGNNGGSTTNPDGSLSASVVIADLISANGWTSETRKQSFNIGNVVSAQVDGGNFSGAAYSDQIRIYASDSPAGTLTISVASGYELVSIKISTAEVTFTVANLCIDGSGSDISNVETSVSGSSVVVQAVKNGSDGKNARITSIEVVYKAV